MPDPTIFPTPGYAPSTTPPTAYAAATYTPSTTPPTAVSAGSYTPSTTPPVAASAADYTPSTTPPVAPGTPLALLANIAALKALATVALVPSTEAPLVRQVFSSEPNEFVQAWQLTAGTQADNVAGGFARPTDYATTTNEKVWKRVL